MAVDTNWIGQFIVAYGLWAIFGLMFLENVFPVLPSEVVIPLAGFVAQRVGLPLWEVIVSASVGAMLGQMPWYYGARMLGYERFKHFAARFGRITTIGPKEVDLASDWFRRHGEAAVFFGRVTPVIRGLISVPAGLTNMPLGRFLAWSVPGSSLWVALLAWAGHALGDRAGPEVERFINPVTKAMVICVVIVWLYRVVTWKRQPEVAPGE